MMQKFMKGVFALKPALPRYGNTWDVSKVLDYLKGQSPPETLSIAALSSKLATLLLLLSGQRGQSLHTLRLENLNCSEDLLTLRFGELLKTSRPGNHLSEINLPAFDDKPGLCVVRTYKSYLKRTQGHRKVRGRGLLFLQTVKPFKPIARNTLGKWVKKTLQRAGINMHVFSPHSTRSASTSSAMAKGVPLSTVLRTAGWRSEDTFRKFYDKPVARDTQFAKAIMHSTGDK